MLFINIVTKYTYIIKCSHSSHLPPLYLTIIFPNFPTFKTYLCDLPVADPGFPVGGRGPRRGGVDSRGGYISKIFYVKMKEFGPLGGACAGHAPSRSANVYDVLYLLKVHSHIALVATLQIGYKTHSLCSVSGNANANGPFTQSVGI